MAKRKAEGFVARGFERVLEEFQRNLDERGELGAAFAATRDGEPVVDLWGGLARDAPAKHWSRDSLQVIFSGTKGLVALCLLMQIDRGLIDPDAPVSDYWPQFAAARKERIRVCEVASHRARLPGIRALLTLDDVLDSERMASWLAEQPQESDPRAAATYHPLTFGWLCAELIRRVDGRSVGAFFAEEVAGPLGLDLWIGLPDRLEARVTTLRCAEGWCAELLDEKRVARDELLRRVWANPPCLRAADRLPWNTRAFHAAQIPGAGAIGTARSIARLYGCLAQGGQIGGIRLVSESVLQRARVCLTSRRDPLTGDLDAFGLGFALQTSSHPFGPAADGFGHTGAGGSVHGAWPAARVGFSYCMNHLRDDVAVDPRPQALLHALHASLSDRPFGRPPAVSPDETDRGTRSRWAHAHDRCTAGREPVAPRDVR
ncbi:MAG: hypothetical protein V7607_5440 [Solirubrobacteraceae bacterium]